MKKAVIWKESVEEMGREALSIEFIADASVVDSWNGRFDKKVAKVEVPQELESIPQHFLEAFFVEETAAIAGSPEHWTNGEDTVYDANAIPTLLDEENNPYLDPSYIYVAAVEEVPAISAHYELRKKAGADEVMAKEAVLQIVKSAIAFGSQLIEEFATENILLGITQDSMTKTVRQNMAEVTAALSTGSLYDAIDEIQSIPAEAKDGKYITDARLDRYQKKIEEFLGI
jgi:hypothetical protein